MATKATAQGQGLGFFQPACGITVLRGCGNCGQPHPRARTPAIDADHCPDCGTPSATVRTFDADASLTGFHPWALTARLFLWLGQQLTRLARSI